MAFMQETYYIMKCFRMLFTILANLMCSPMIWHTHKQTHFGSVSCQSLKFPNLQFFLLAAQICKSFSQRSVPSPKRQERSAYDDDNI